MRPAAVLLFFSLACDPPAAMPRGNLVTDTGGTSSGATNGSSTSGSNSSGTTGGTSTGSGTTSGGTSGGGTSGGTSGSGTTGGGTTSGTTTGGSGALPTDTFCFPERWCWEHPTLNGADIDRIYAPSANQAWIHTSGGIVAFWNGSSWQQVAVPIFVDDVFGDPSGNVWIEGHDSNVNRKSFRLSGSGWQEMGAAHGDETGPAFSADDLWLFSEYNGADHWDGTRWVATAPGINSPSAMWGASAADVWLLGGPISTAQPNQLSHFDGATWTPQANNVLYEAQIVFGFAANDVWADGMWGAFHYDGSKWSDRSDFPKGTTMWGAGAKDVWVGSNLGLSHWNGSAVDRSDSIDSLYGPKVITGTASNDVWVGAEGGRLQYWNGSTWTKRAGTRLSNQNLRALSDGKSGQTWAVGDGGLLMKLSASGWSVFQSNTANPLHAVWSGAADDVWAAGDDVFVHCDPTCTATSASGQTLRAVFGLATNDVWLAGDQGTVLHYDGSTTTSVPSFSTAGFYYIHGSATDNVWFAGGGDVRAWDGHTLETKPGQMLEGLVVRGPGDVLGLINAGGAQLVHFDGAQWSKQGTVLSTSTNDPQQLLLDRAGNPYVLWGNQIFAGTGTAVVTLPFFPYCLHPQFLDGGELRCVGDGASILHYYP